MKQFLKFPFCMALGAMLFATTACSDHDVDDEDYKTREMALQAATTSYVNNTVIWTYKNLADESLDLYDKCAAMQSAFNAGNLTTDLIKAAGDEWKSTRQYWEISEAFLYGPADYYNIDPHIDSWPLDKDAMEELLGDSKKMADIIANGMDNENNYGLLGFHAIEYMLFELDATGTASGPRNPAKFTNEEMIYFMAVVKDLRNQCIRLEASWAGLGNVSSEKQQILQSANLVPDQNFGSLMLNAGSNNNYINYLATAQELLEGCLDIADEVGTQKIGRPANGTTQEDIDYIESPYSLNSITDFVGNIQSIQNAYSGRESGDASVSNYIKSIDPDADAKVKSAIANAINAIKQIQEPFAQNRTSSAARNAVTVVGTDLVNALQEAEAVLNRH